MKTADYFSVAKAATKNPQDSVLLRLTEPQTNIIPKLIILSMSSS